MVDLDLSYRERVHRYQIHNYMYGQYLEPPKSMTAVSLGGEELSDFRLSPISTVINFGDLTIYRIGGGKYLHILTDHLNLMKLKESIAPSSALPIGATRTVSEMQPIEVDPNQKGSGLLNAVLALLAPPNPDENERYDEEVLDLEVIGFLIVYVNIFYYVPLIYVQSYSTALDITNKKMTVLMPSQMSLVGRMALMGSFEYQEQ